MYFWTSSCSKKGLLWISCFSSSSSEDENQESKSNLFDLYLVLHLNLNSLRRSISVSFSGSFLDEHSSFHQSWSSE